MAEERGVAEEGKKWIFQKKMKKWIDPADRFLLDCQFGIGVFAKISEINLLFLSSFLIRERNFAANV